MDDVVLPPSGGWVLIKHNANMPAADGFIPPLLSIWYAMPARVFQEGEHLSTFWLQNERISEADLTTLWRVRHTKQTTMESEKALVEKLKDISLVQRVRTVTPGGEMWFEPYEWLPLPKIEPYLQEVGKDVQLHQLGGFGKGVSVKDRAFYMIQHGVPKDEAWMMLMGPVRKPNMFWLEIDQGYASFFGLDAPRPKKRTISDRMKVTLTNDERHYAGTGSEQAADWTAASDLEEWSSSDDHDSPA